MGKYAVLNKVRNFVDYKVTVTKMGKNSCLAGQPSLMLDVLTAQNCCWPITKSFFQNTICYENKASLESERNFGNKTLYFWLWDFDAKRLTAQKGAWKTCNTEYWLHSGSTFLHKTMKNDDLNEFLLQSIISFLCVIA